MDIRLAQEGDLRQLLKLYTQLHDNTMPIFDVNLERLWSEILKDNNHHIVLGVIDEQIASSCVLVVVPNLTRNQRPYALVENVITHAAYRNKGYASLVLEFAKDIALRKNCYKIMLLTGSKQESTFRFYEKAGYNKNDKTAFVQWFD